MLKYINLKKLTAKTLIGLLMVSGLIGQSSNKQAVAANGVQGLELRYLDSAIQCGDDPTPGRVEVEVYKRTNGELELLSTMSKTDTFLTTEVDSVSDLILKYKIFNLACLPEGEYRESRDTKILASGVEVPNIPGLNGQASITEMLGELDSSYKELYLVELGNRSGSGYDLQDVVLVVDNNPQFAD